MIAPMMDQGEWIELGVLLGFCAEPECQTHGLVAMTAEESAEFEEGGDPCVPVLRLWHEGEAQQHADVAQRQSTTLPRS